MAGMKDKPKADAPEVPHAWKTHLEMMLRWMIKNGVTRATSCGVTVAIAKESKK